MEVLGVGKAPQAVDAQVAEGDAGGQGVADEPAGGLGHDDLPPVGGVGDAGRPVHVDADIVVPAQGPSPVWTPIRTRTGGPGDQSWAARPRWAATAARIAPTGLRKATKKASPWVLTSVPPASATARRTIAACSSWTAGYRSPSAWSRRVEPSMSVKRNVTVPVGRSVLR